MSHSVVPSEQPPDSGSPAPALEQDLYGLLGLTPFESNPDVISSTVRKLMRETRKYQLGPHAARTHSRMEELASATACLLDPARKRSYDEDLRRRYGMPPVSVSSTYAGPAREELAAAQVQLGLPRRDGGGKRSTLLLLLLAGVASLAWGYRLLTPERTKLTDPTGNPSSARPRAVGSPPARTVGKGRSAARTPEGRKGPGERNPVLADSGAAAVPTTVERENEIAAAVRMLATDAVNRAPSGEIGTDSPPAGERAPRTQQPVAPMPDRRPAPSPANPAPVRPPQERSATPANRKPPAAPGLQMTGAEVLRELRDVRLKRPPALRLATSPRSIGAERAVELVQYARSEFRDDRRFQRQLDQEVVALRRVYPQLRDVLPGPSRP